MASHSSDDNQGSHSPHSRPSAPSLGPHTATDSPNVPSVSISQPPHNSEDVEMAELGFNDMPSLLDVSDSEGSEVEVDMAEAPVLEPNHPSIVTPQPTMSFPSFSSVLSQPSSSQPTTSNRRARVEDDDDEDRDRRHPSQRVISPPSHSATPLGARRVGPSGPRRDPQAASASPASPSTSGRPNSAPNPFRFFHQFITPTPPSASPPATATAGPNAAPPGTGQSEPRLPTDFIGGITFTLDFTRGPPPPLPTDHAGQDPADPVQEPGSPPPPGPFEDGELPTGQSRSLAEALARIGLLAQMLGGGLGGLPEEKEDPERAKKLVTGLEEVPVGLVKRLVRVGGSGGGMGEDESKGGDAGCAICWDSLLLEQDPDAAEPTPQPKIVSLPCAHVFHADCLIPWFSRPKQTTCPSCRFNIDPDNLTYVSWRQRRRERREREREEQQNTANTDASNTDDVQPAESAPQPTAAPDPAPTLDQPHDPLGSPPTDQGSPIRERLIPIPVILPITVPAAVLQGLHIPPQAPTSAASPPTSPSNPPTGTPTPPNAAANPFADYTRLLSRVLSRPPPTNGQPTQAPNTNTPTGLPPFGPAPNIGQPRTQFGTFDMGNGVHADVLTIGIDVLLGVPFGPAPPTGAGAPTTSDDTRSPTTGPDSPTGNPTPAPTAEPPRRTRLDFYNQFIPTILRSGEPRPFGPSPPPANPVASVSSQGDAPRQPAPTPSANPQPIRPQFLFSNFNLGPGPGGVGNTGNPAGGNDLPFEDFMARLFGPRPPQPQTQAQPDQADAQTPPEPPAAAPAPDGPTPPPRGFLDLLSLFGPPIILAGGPGGPGMPGATPRERQDRPKRPWTPPPAPGPTLRERIERREREAGLRCCDMSCGVGPSDEEPELSETAMKLKQLSIRSEDGAEVCCHRFHSSCLVSAERVALKGEDAREEHGQVAVSCPVCRGSGSVLKAEWDEGVACLY